MTNESFDIEKMMEWVNETLQEWASHIDAAEFQLAAELAVSAVKVHCSQIVSEAPERYKQVHYGVRVVLNGVRDVANVQLIITNSGWIETPQAVEWAWHTAHDAQDRLRGHTGLDPEFLAFCLDQLNPVFELVNDRYGQGIYTSTETYWDRYLCSICARDIRECDHTPGNFYDGRECDIEPEGLTPRAVALVTNPRDPRCRIWPWLKRREVDGRHVIEGVPILIAFDPAGYECDEGVVDLEALGILRRPSPAMVAEVMSDIPLGRINGR